MQKHIITISGMPGSGKSSTADQVAKELGYKRFSSGDFLRQIGLSRGLSIEEIDALAKTDPAIDDEIDETIRTIGAGERLVIDSRLAFHWLPQAFKVFLKLDPHTAAERTFKQVQESGRVGQDGKTVEEVFQKTAARIENETKRYQEKYGVNYLDEKNFDLVIDTAEHPLEEVARQIVEKYQEWLNA